MPVSKKPRRKSRSSATSSSAGAGLRLLAIFAGIPLAVIAGYFGLVRLLDNDDGARDEVLVPALSSVAMQGEQLFAASCAQCHGANAAGSDNGPPLVHRIYEPNHHGDRAFYRAVQQGVRAHHWQFGDMAPVPAVSEEDVGLIVRYVRELQQANGIF